MLKIRLKRVGKKRDSAFRIIVTQAGSSINSGKYLDQVGFYDPRTNKKDIDVEKATKWLANGAQATGTVYNLLVDAGVIKGRKKNVLPRKTAPVVEVVEEEVKEAPVDEKEATSEEEDTNVVEEAVDEVVEEVKETVEEVKEVADEVADKVKEVVEDVKEEAAEVVEEVKVAAAETKEDK